MDKTDVGYDAYTPLLHRELDDWGLARGTRVWMADGTYKKVQDLVPGDIVLGIAYRLEDEWINRQIYVAAEHNLVKVWKPSLCERKVLAVNEVQARSWELTFGNEQKQMEDRRLVAGGLTPIALFPYSHDDPRWLPMGYVHTTLPNPRVGSHTKQGLEVDQFALEQTGRIQMRPGPTAGEAVGDFAMCVPGSSYAGAMRRINTSTVERDYDRMTSKKVRDVDVYGESESLFQIWCSPTVAPVDPTDPDGEQRIVLSNLIAQTPFPPNKVTRQVRDHDPLAAAKRKAGSWDELARNWEGFGNQYAEAGKAGKSLDPQQTETFDMETMTGGQFHLSKRGDFGDAFTERTGLNEWLNGGILLALPVRDEDHAHYAKRKVAPVAAAANPDDDIPLLG